MSKYMKPETLQQRPTLVVFGNTGSGKSTLGNTLLGRDQFATSDDVVSETKETIGAEGVFMNQPVYVIDTPGLQDSSGLDAKHLTDMTTYIRQNREVQAFVFVINFLNMRLDNTVRRLFQLVGSMYPGKKWYHHVAVVWTNYWSLMPPNIKATKGKKQQGFKDFFRREVVPTITDMELEAIPQYFVDSCEAQEAQETGQPDESLDELSHLVAWVAACPRMVDNVGEIRDVDSEVKEKVEETREFLIDTHQHLNVVTRVYITRRRYREVMYSGRVTHTDWEDVAGSEREATKVLPPEPHGASIIKKRIRQIKIGEVVKDAHPVSHMFQGKNFHGELYDVCKEVREEQILQPMTDGTTHEGEWMVISERKYETNQRHVIRDQMDWLKRLTRDLPPQVLSIRYLQ